MASFFGFVEVPHFLTWPSWFIADWKTHVKDHYECNKFSDKKADALSAKKFAPHLEDGSVGRRELVKYLFHYERVSTFSRQLFSVFYTFASVAFFPEND